LFRRAVTTAAPAITQARTAIGVTVARTTAADVAIGAGLVVAGLGIRLWCWSGVGLGDDPIFWNFMGMLLGNGSVPPGNLGYRFTWWLPTALVAQAIGQNELSMVVPYLGYSLLGIALVYAFARTLWGRWAAVVAAGLVAVHPLDVTWSTMITNDIALSFFLMLTMFAFLRALAHTDPVARRRAWVGAAVGLFLCYHSKVNGILLVPALGAIAYARRGRVADGWWFLGPLLVLFGASAVVSYAFTGSVIGPVYSEIAWQGLRSDPVGHRVTPSVLLIYPRLLFLPDHLGDLLNGIYPHALFLLLLLSLPLRLRVEPALWWWFLAVFFGMEFNMSRIDGHWAAGFRNIRHAHVFVYPLVLLLTGYLVALRARWPRLATASCVLLAATGLWQARAAATKTQVAFADCREACRFLATVPLDVMYLDDIMRIRCLTLAMDTARTWTLPALPAASAPRAAALAKVEHGYVVTGGGREPIYGYPGQIFRAADLPAGRADVIFERDGPVDPVWRPEPLRVWKLRPRLGASP
jgi:hypothetical protein